MGKGVQNLLPTRPTPKPKPVLIYNYKPQQAAADIDTANLLLRFILMPVLILIACAAHNDGDQTICLAGRVSWSRMRHITAGRVESVV